MTSQEKDTYFVAVKVFLEQDGKLLILKDNFGDWYLPGGRIKTDEFDVSLEQVVHRKLKEELGSNINYSIGNPCVYMRHERTEASTDGQKVRIFALGYTGALESGEIKLSARHVQLEWVDKTTFQPEQYFTGGWLKGVQEYIKLSQK